MGALRRITLLLVAAVAVVAAGCGTDGPGPGSTWTIDAVDRSGVFGSITITRGDIVDLPDPLGEAVPGATRAMLVHVAYETDRGSDTGYGAVEWGASVGDEEISEAAASFRIQHLVSQLDWPVEGALGTQLPGGREPLEGWIVIALSEDELRQPVTLRYQPLLVDLGNNAFDNQLETELVIHEP
jgi:hypothetical protein